MYHVPVYFLHGVHDYTASPMFEEPERLRRIIEQDVFGGTNSLADQT